MSKLAILVSLLFATLASAAAEAPSRIVSLDYCADQYVLRLVDRARILALSPDAGKTFSYMRDQAAGVPTVRPLAENVLILKPDLVVRAYGGGPNAARLFERANVNVLQVGYANSIEETLTVLQDMGDGLGASAEAEALAHRTRTRLAAIKPLAG